MLLDFKFRFICYFQLYLIIILEAIQITHDTFFALFWAPPRPLQQFIFKNEMNSKEFFFQSLIVILQTSESLFTHPTPSPFEAGNTKHSENCRLQMSTC